MRKTQPFFLQVSPAKSLYWPFSPDEPQGTRAPTMASLSPYCHHFFPLSNLRRALLFPLISQPPTAIAIWFLPLLNDEDQLFCRTRAAWLSWHPALHQCTIWRSKPKKNCIFPKRAAIQDIPREFHPTSQRTQLGFEHGAIAMACSSWRQDTWKRQDLVLRRLCLETGSRNYPV